MITRERSKNRKFPRNRFTVSMIKALKPPFLKSWPKFALSFNIAKNDKTFRTFPDVLEFPNKIGSR